MEFACKRMSINKIVQVGPPRAGTEATSTNGFFCNRIMQTTSIPIPQPQNVSKRRVKKTKTLKAQRLPTAHLM
jgi:hypothetical protein